MTTSTSTPQKLYLMLVASLSATWGIYRTPTGKAVYFTLAFEPGPPGGDGRAQTWGL